MRKTDKAKEGDEKGEKKTVYEQKLGSEKGEKRCREGGGIGKRKKGWRSGEDMRSEQRAKGG